MTFLSVQQFDPDGEIKVVKSKRKILETVDNTDNTTVTGKARIKYEYAALTSDDLEPVSLSEAEARVLEECDIFWGMSNPPLNHVPEDCHLAHRISMASANIGSNTKRGPGNTIVCHPDNRDAVDQCWDKTKTVSRHDAEQDEMIDQQVPYFPQGPLKVIEHLGAPLDRILVLYRGEDDTDQPLIYVEGEGFLQNGLAAPVESYGKFVAV